VRDFAFSLRSNDYATLRRCLRLAVVVFAHSGAVRQTGSARSYTGYFNACFYNLLQLRFLEEHDHPLHRAICQDLRSIIEEEAECCFGLFAASTANLGSKSDYKTMARRFEQLPAVVGAVEKLKAAAQLTSHEGSLLAVTKPILDCAGTNQAPTADAIKKGLVEIFEGMKAGTLVYSASFPEAKIKKGKAVDLVTKCLETGPYPDPLVPVSLSQGVRRTLEVCRRLMGASNAQFTDVPAEWQGLLDVCGGADGAGEEAGAEGSDQEAEAGGEGGARAGGRGRGRGGRGGRRPGGKRGAGRLPRRHAFFGAHKLGPGCSCQMARSAGRLWAVEGHWFPIVGCKVRRGQTRWWAVLVLDDVEYPQATAADHTGTPKATMKRCYVARIKDAEGRVHKPHELDLNEEPSSASSAAEGQEGGSSESD